MVMSIAPVLSIRDLGGVVYGVEVGATFLTGVEVDVAASLVSPDEEGAGARLERSTSVPFRASRATLRRSDGSFYAVNSSEHGTEVIPPTLATVDSEWVLANCDRDATPDGWRLRAAACDIHDFGVGMIVLDWKPAVETSARPEDLAEILDKLSLASHEAVADLAHQIATTCRATLADDPARLNLARGLDLESVAVLPPIGDILWLWHVVLVSSSESNHSGLTCRLASVVCPNDYKLLKYRDHTLAAGVHVSVACSVRGRENDARFLARAPRLQDPWWTLFWRLDRVLLSLQLRLEASLDAHAPSELRKRAEILYEVSSRVSLLRSRLDSFLVSSGARDVAAWQVLGEAWDLPYRIDVVDKKMSLLRRAYSEAVIQISSSRAARVNFMIYVFTAFSLVASVVAVVQFTQGAVDERVVVRLVVVILSVMVALLAVLLSVRTTRAKRTRGY
jgi:hypothetical protein